MEFVCTQMTLAQARLIMACVKNNIGQILDVLLCLELFTEFLPCENDQDLGLCFLSLRGREEGVRRCGCRPERDTELAESGKLFTLRGWNCGFAVCRQSNFNSDLLRLVTSSNTLEAWKANICCPGPGSGLGPRGNLDASGGLLEPSRTEVDATWRHLEATWSQGPRGAKVPERGIR